MMTRATLLLSLLLLAPALAAVEGRSPAEVDRLYHEVGAQMFCVCGGCREGLLECTMTNCSTKLTQRDFLRALCADPANDAPAIRQAMVTRFTPKVLQVPDDSSLFPVLAAAGALLLLAFGTGFWYVTQRGKAAAAAASAEIDPDLEARIARELKELDE